VRGLDKAAVSYQPSAVSYRPSVGQCAGLGLCNPGSQHRGPGAPFHYSQNAHPRDLGHRPLSIGSRRRNLQQLCSTRAGVTCHPTADAVGGAVLARGLPAHTAASHGTNFGLYQYSSVNQLST